MDLAWHDPRHAGTWGSVPLTSPRGLHGTPPPDGDGGGQSKAAVTVLVLAPLA